MNKHLKSFLQSYLDWAILGAPETGDGGNPLNLNRGSGLCDNLNGYVWMMTVEPGGITRGEAFIIEDELSALFANDDLDTDFPFGEDAFHLECEMRTHHTNEDRIDWIRKQLEVK